MKKFKFSAVALSAVSAVVLATFMAGSPTRGDGDSNGRSADSSRIQQGFANAPLPLNLRGKNRALVGLGSYFVNVSGGCNDCHTVNHNPYLPGGNPFLGQPMQINPTNYLVGGTEFIPAHPPNFPAIVSRNLRPEANGLPEGHTFEEFLLILRTGIDLDHAHPQYGPLLQVMPWPNFRNMTDMDIRAIYEYLSALPPNPNPQP